MGALLGDAHPPTYANCNYFSMTYPFNFLAKLVGKKGRGNLLNM